MVSGTLILCFSVAVCVSEKDKNNVKHTNKEHYQLIRIFRFGLLVINICNNAYIMHGYLYAPTCVFHWTNQMVAVPYDSPMKVMTDIHIFKIFKVLS